MVLVMAMRKKSDPTKWRDTPAGIAAYRAVRTEAQAKANESGFDYGIEANDVFKTWRSFLLPQKRNRYGFELFCEVVSCERLENCKPGHGPMGGK